MPPDADADADADPDPTLMHRVNRRQMGRTAKHIDQVSHRFNLLRDVIRQDRAKLFLECNDRFDCIEGIQTQISLEVCGFCERVLLEFIQPAKYLHRALYNLVA